MDLQEAEIRRLQRKLDRSRRANNPDNYEANGTVKKGVTVWRASNHDKKLAARLAEHPRRTAATRKIDHGALVNTLLQFGGTIKIENRDEVARFTLYDENEGVMAATSLRSIF